MTRPIATVPEWYLAVWPSLEREKPQDGAYRAVDSPDGLQRVEITRTSRSHYRVRVLNGHACRKLETWAVHGWGRAIDVAGDSLGVLVAMSRP